MKKVFLSISVMLGYMGMRFFVYGWMPQDSMRDWFWRDTVMDIPRLIWSAVALYFGYRIWGWQGLGFHRKGGALALVVGAFMISSQVLFSMMGSSPFVLPSDTLLIFYLSSFIVGFFEEILFRGVLLNALRDWKGNFIALWISSFLFTIFHIQAQPFYGWAGIFIDGFALAYMRLNGVSIVWLMLIHGLYDCVVGVVGRSVGMDMILFHNGALFAMALLLVAWMRFHRGAVERKAVTH